MSSVSPLRYIVADVGGTNARFQLFEVREELRTYGGGDRLMAEHIYSSQKYKSFPPMVAQFISDHIPDSIPPFAACLAVAGPVLNDSARVTNRGWEFTVADIKSATKIAHVSIINDFEGIGLGLLALAPHDLIPLNPPAHRNLLSHADPKHGGVKACVGAGTGLGECLLTYNGKEFDVWGTEGGHTTFAPQNAKQFGLMEYIMKNRNLQHVSAERVVSGMGLPDIFDYLSTLEPGRVNKEVKTKINHMKENDKSKDIDSIRSIIISDYALTKKCPVCVEAMEIFVSAFAHEAGNMALKTLPRGGMYIAGGIVTKIMWAIKRNQFAKQFANKGRMTGILNDQIPLYVVTNAQVGLLGARVMAQRLLANAGVSVPSTAQQNQIMAKL